MSSARRMPAKAMRKCRRKTLRKEVRSTEARVAHEPPLRTRWSPSNQSSEYSGYGKGSKPLKPPNGVEVHSQTLPVMSRQPHGDAPAGKKPTGVVPQRRTSKLQRDASGSSPPHAKRRFALLDASHEAAFSHSASVGRRLPAKRA